MAEFICRLGTPSGEIITRIVEAAAANDAKAKLEVEGFRVFAISAAESGLSLAFSGGRSTKARIKQGDFLLFNQQLSALLRAGIPILQSINMLKNRAASSSLRAVLDDVEEKIKSGMPLSEAFEAQRIFPRIYTASILAGERSGALDEVLARYVTYLRRSVGLGRKIRGALAYPAFLLVAAIVMVSFLSLYVIPRMSDLFKSLNSKQGLPTVTVIVLSFSGALSNNIIWLGPLLLVVGLFLFFWIRSPGGKLVVDNILLRIPLAGTLLKQVATAQLSRSMSTLLSGGITVVDSWDISSQSITNLELRRRSQAVLPMIREGRSFSEALEKANWLPALALDMIGIGERSGSLKEMLDEVSQFYDAEAEVRLEQLTSLLEPFILAIMAAFVVTILLAIYMPILQMISSGPMSGGGAR
jgi:type IV pilus assembly protein PilC